MGTERKLWKISRRRPVHVSALQGCCLALGGTLLADRQWVRPSKGTAWRPCACSPSSSADLVELCGLLAAFHSTSPCNSDSDSALHRGMPKLARLHVLLMPKLGQLHVLLMLLWWHHATLHAGETFAADEPSAEAASAAAAKAKLFFDAPGDEEPGPRIRASPVSHQCLTCHTSASLVAVVTKRDGQWRWTPRVAKCGCVQCGRPAGPAEVGDETQSGYLVGDWSRDGPKGASPFDGGSIAPWSTETPNTRVRSSRC
eukprot:366014-Chlamydomonas_euryale.AAC.5